MLEEALASSAAVHAQLQCLDRLLVALVRRLRRQPPQVVLTVARGSADHAAS